MHSDRKDTRSLYYLLILSITFGIWQHSISSGIFMFFIVLFIAIRLDE